MQTSLRFLMVVGLAALWPGCAGDDTPATTPADTGHDAAADGAAPGADAGADGASDARTAAVDLALRDGATDAQGSSDGGPQREDAGADGGNLPPAHPLQLGLMVHLEGWRLDNERTYQRYVTGIEELGALFDSYGAKLTLETRIMASACAEFGDGDGCILADLEARGHGIGVHADIGGNPRPGYTLERFSADLVGMKEEMETQGLTVRHASGVCSAMDWVTAVHDAELLFATGIVEYCALSLSDGLLPDELKGCPSPSECHGPFPISIAERLHPWRARSGSEWTLGGPDGPLVIISAVAGLVHLYEELGGGEPGAGEFDRRDVDTFVTVLDEALRLQRPDRPAVFYLGLSIGELPDQELMEAWLQAAQPYVDAGQVEWATLPEMYDTFVAWETRRQ